MGIAIAMTALARAQTPTLIHAYTFDDGTATDVAGTANGTLNGGATISNGQLGLDGTSGFVQFGTRLIPTSGSFSVTVLAQATTVSGYAELISQGQSLGPGFFIGYDPDRNFRLGDNLLSTSIPFPTDGAMHHYALTVDGTNTRFYIDGVLTGTFPAIALAATGDNTRLGKQFSPYGEFFSGRLDEVRIYAGALGATQVAALFAENDSVLVGANSYRADHLTNAARGTATGLLVYGGQGIATDASWNGKVVLLDRGTGTFYTKAHNVQLSGGLACIIANNVPGNVSGSLGDGNFATIPAVSVSQEDGAVLKSIVNATVTVMALVGRTAPTIVTQPQSQTVSVGTGVSLSVVATGAAPLSYQWRIDGLPIPDPAFRTSTLTLNPQAAGSGRYSVVVSNAAGSVTSNEAVLTVTAVRNPPAITTPPRSQTVNSGDAATLSVAASGAGSYQWQLNGANLPGATNATLSLPNVQPSAVGDYTVIVANGNGSTTSNAATIGLVPGRLINLSVLTPIAPGDPLTVGTVIGGNGATGAMPLLIRAGGPSLAALGVSTPLADPKLDVFSGSNVVATNDNWGGTAELTALASQVGAFPFANASSRDAAVAFGPNISAPPTSYTVQVTGAGGTTGPAIAEVYDGVPATTVGATTPRLINVSVLKQIPANGSLTAGFVIGGATPKQVLVRAIGPTLGAAPFNVAGAMPNPKITLFDSTQTVIATNDDWGGDATLATGFAAAGAFALPGSSRDAALLVTLAPGNYTAQVAASTAIGAAAGGLVLVEVYDLEGGAAPAVASLPATFGTTAGSMVMLVASATGAVGYQWQRLPAGSSTWVTLADGDGFAGTATASLYASGAAAQDGDQYRVIVTNSSGIARSNPVTLTFTTAPTPSGINVPTFAAPQARAMDVVTFAATGLTAGALTYVEFLNPAGTLIAQVPPLAVTGNNVTVAVPMLLGSDGTSLTGGTLSARLVQWVAGTPVVSNTFKAVDLQSSPVSKVQPGALALSVLQAQQDEVRNLLAALPGGDSGVTGARDTFNSTIQSLQKWIDNVQRAMSSGSATFTVGSAPGTSVTLTSRELQMIDNLLVASLQAVAGNAASSSSHDVPARAAAGTSATQSAAVALQQAAATGTAIGSRAKDFVATLGGALTTPEGQAVLSIADVAIGSFVLGAALTGGPPVVGALAVATLGLGAIGLWDDALMATKRPLSDRLPASFNEAIERRNRLLDLGAPGGMPSELAGSGVGGLIDAFPDPLERRPGLLRLAIDERHGAHGKVDRKPRGFVVSSSVDPLPFISPAAVPVDPTEVVFVYPSQLHAFGTEVTFDALPRDGSVFLGWRIRAPFFDAPYKSAAGSDPYLSAGTADPQLKLTMVEGGLFLVATFDVAHTLTISGGTSVTIAAEPFHRAADIIAVTGGSIDRSPEPKRYLGANGVMSTPGYLHGQRVRLEARPSSGSTFTSWSGDYTGNDNPTTIEITRDMRVTANFKTSAPPTPPVAPSGLIAAGANQQVALAWNVSSGATSYRVKRATTTGGPYTTIASPTDAIYLDSTVTNGTTYYYVVTAVSSTGESGNSNQVSATPTAGAAPSAPSGLTATASNGQVALVWSASSSATSYRVKRATTSGGPYTQIANPTGTSYTDTGLTNGTTYYYVVTAVNGGGESGNSNQASATPSGGSGGTASQFDGNYNGTEDGAVTSPNGGRYSALSPISFTITNGAIVSWSDLWLSASVPARSNDLGTIQSATVSANGALDVTVRRVTTSSSGTNTTTAHYTGTVTGGNWTMNAVVTPNSQFDQSGSGTWTASKR